MEDSRIRRALEAVAGLYLTGRDRRSEPTSNGATGNGAAEHGVAEHDAADDGAAEPHTATAAPSSHNADPPAASFPETDEHEPLAPQPGATPRVEALLLGHLPGYATPWISQYAHHLAQRHGSAALLRVEEGAVRVERFDATDDDEQRSSCDPRHEPRSLDAPGGGDDPAGGVPGDLFEVLTELGTEVGVCIVALERRANGEPDRERLGDLPRWTLLSGADDAATVGGYRLLKGLLGFDGPGEPEQGIGVMFMGCDESAARGAVHRLRLAIEAHLGAAIEMAGTHPRFEPVHRHELGSYELDAPGWARLRDWLEEFRRQPEPPAPDQAPPAWLAPADIDLTQEELAALHAPEDPDTEPGSAPDAAAERVPDHPDPTPETPAGEPAGHAPEPSLDSETAEAAEAPDAAEPQHDEPEPRVTIRANGLPRGPAQHASGAAADGPGAHDPDSTAESLHAEVIRMGGTIGVDPPPGSAPAPSEPSTHGSTASPGESVGEGSFAAPSASAGASASAQASTAFAEPPAAEAASAADPAAHRTAAADGRAEHPSTAEGSINPVSHLEGVEPIEARCPRHPAVRLGLDDGGRLHLALFQPGASSIAAAARRLTEAGRWAVEHRSLIGLTRPDHPLDPRSAPVLHLMTDDPRAALDLSLIGLAEQHAIRLHLLKAVTVAGQAVHLHEPLN